MWGPLLGWCVLESLAESVDAEAPQKMALDLFDSLRLREPFAQALSSLGFEGEEPWRVAARIKVVLLSEAGIAQAEAISDVPETQAPASERVALAADLWTDPDVRWLTGAHQADGHSYLIREPYEELLWWLLMPTLLKQAGEPTLNRHAIVRIGEMVDEALASAEAAGYRIDALLEPPTEPTPTEPEREESPDPVPVEPTELTPVVEIAEVPTTPTAPEPKPRETLL
jgi:hypothetical protein